MPDLLLDRPSRTYRAAVARGIDVKEDVTPVERNGGDYKAGLIRRVSVATVGEALGHNQWLDGDTLAEVAGMINAKPDGVKARFAHPSASGDGIGKMTGRFKNASVEGDRVFADWHALESAHATPEGDLAGYIMDLAEEAPQDFGASIAFQHDQGNEKRFMTENAGADGRFVSPDERNRNNYPHVRLAALRAVDIVDEPAANPAGLFHRNPFEMLDSGEELLAYAFGLSDEAPDTSNLGIDATRLRGFVQRFASSRGVTFSKGTTMPDTENKPEEKLTEQLSADQIKAEAVKSERQRVADITALCAQAKCPEKSHGFIESGATVSECQTALFKSLTNSLEPVGESAKEEPKPADENDAYRAEYKAEPLYAKSMTEDEFIAMRRIDDGKDQLTIGAAK
jgi:hypothetical protein